MIYDTDMHVDRRHKKTESAIQNALIKLVLDRGYESIKINDLIEVADINKSTFYLHYYSLLGVVYALEDQLVSETLSAWNESNGELSDRFLSFLSFLTKEKKKFLTVFAIGDGHFYKKAESTFSPFIEVKEKDKENAIYLRSFLFGGIYGAIRSYLAFEGRTDKNKLVKLILGILKMSNEKMD